MLTEFRENTIKHPLILDIRSIRSHLGLLRETVMRNKGQVIYLIHPFFNQYLEIHDDNLLEWNAKQTHALRVFEQIKRYESVIIFAEERQNMDSTQTSLRLLTSQATILMVPTKTVGRIIEPTPDILGFEGTDALKWRALIAKMRLLGIETVLLGGREYYNIEGNESGCVNGVKRSLQSDFDLILIPELCYPHQPK